MAPSVMSTVIRTVLWPIQLSPRSRFPLPITLWFTCSEARGFQAPAQETGIQGDDACQAVNCLELGTTKISSCS